MSPEPPPPRGPRPHRNLSAVPFATAFEREIDSFARQWEDGQSRFGTTIRMGKVASLGEQLTRIEMKATALRAKKPPSESDNPGESFRRVRPVARDS
jgi:hypothetical protein